MGNAPDGELSSLLVESLKVLETAVDSLLRLGVAIQQSSVSTLTQRINAFVKRKDEGVLEEMIYPHLRHLLVDREREEGNHGAALSLCRQLAGSISFRYFAILYVRNHAAKKRDAVSHEETTAGGQAQRMQLSKPASGASAHGRTAAPSTMDGGGKEPSAIRHHRINHAVPLSETAPSIPDSDVARRKYAEPPKSFFGTKSVISIRTPGNVRYPKPPKVEPHAKDAICPYCCNRHDKSKYERKDWWE